ncbi:MAG: ribonuclease J [Bacilli bacterium]|nr:ribonuclease J [Bacilli bacterium]
MDSIKICALGGLDESGRDCYVVEINDDIFVLDYGASLPDKTLPGIDFLIPNNDYLIKNKHRIKGYIMTHGHDENMAGLKYVYDQAPAPIYCTETTKAIMEWESKLYHIKPKFLFVTVKPTSEVYIGSVRFRFFQTMHNICESIGVAIETDRGWIIYSSDFIVDYTVSNPGYIFDINSLIKRGNKDDTLILLCESKGANRPGYCSPKHRLTALIKDYFNDEKRIFISCFWENFYRLEEIARLCHEHKKKVYVYDEYARNLLSDILSLPFCPFNKNDFISPEDLLRVRKQDMVVLMLGYGEELYEKISLLAKGQNPDKRITLDSDDIFISAALPMLSLETVATHSIDDLYRTGCTVEWVTNKKIVSMHAREDDIRALLTLLKPKYYFPVRGTYVNLLANARLAISTGLGLNPMNVFVLDNGMQVVFDEAPRPRVIPNEVNQINIAPLLVDGRGITSIEEDTMEERKKLSEDGVVVVASTVSLKEKTIVSGPDTQMRGFVYVKEAEPLIKSITNIYIDEITTALNMGETNFEKVKLAICDRAKKYIKRENGREPLILPIVIIVD